MNINDRYNRIVGHRKSLLKKRKILRRKLKDSEKRYHSLVKARWVLNQAVGTVQSNFKEAVESLVTMAIRSIFNRPFDFKLKFEEKRNQMEAHPIIEEKINEDNKRIYKNLEDDLGGSILDIIGFVFNIIIFSLSSPQKRNVLLLDEPFKFTGALAILAGKVLREISQKRNIQFIIVTHDERLMEFADRTFFIGYNKKKEKTVIERVMENGKEKRRSLKRIRIK